MPIIDLQRRLPEVGRLRMGTSKPGKRGGKLPVRLETWRVTSQDEERVREIAERYGGDVKPWDEREGFFEVITEATQLPILLVPGQALSQWWEMWTQPAENQPMVCTRRCDGVTEQISGGPCVCPVYDERRELATDGKACSAHSRLSVVLSEIPGIGHYRLETKGYYAAVELQATVGLLEEATRRGMLFPAVLRIDWRRGVQNGSRTTYPVPVVDVAVRAPEIMTIAGGREAAELITGVAGALPRPQYEPVPAGETGGVSLRQGLETVERQSAPAVKTARSAAPLGELTPAPEPAASPLTGAAPTAADPPVVDVAPPVAPPPPQVEPPPVGEQVAGDARLISDAQRRRLWAIISERQVPEDYVRQVLLEVTDQDSSKGIPRELYDAVVTCVMSYAAPASTPEEHEEP